MRDLLLSSRLILACMLPALFWPVVQDSHAQQNSEGPTEAVSGSTTSTPEMVPSADLLIGNSDLLQVSIFGSEDFRQEVRVGSTGNISLPLIGSVVVGGLSPQQAQGLIRDRLIQGRYYKDPQVSVFVREYASAGVYVLGEVQRPGFYPLLNIRRLLEAISVAGGTTPTAGREVTITNPRRPQGTLTVMQSPASAESADQNIAVMPGDTILVSKAGIVYVVGDVRMPTGVVMDRGGLTVLKAIAVAQGPNPTAALSSVKLIRKQSEARQEITLSLKDILTGKAPDPTLQPDDILFVPTSAAKSAGRRTLETALQVVTGIAIYRRY